jgi:Cd2+/Zn2+-exporting ATPase
VDKAPGDSVYAGSINGQGSLDVRVTHKAADTTLAHIIHLIEEAQAARAPSQAFVDRFAQIYTPIVLALAVLIALLPPLLFGQAFDDWFYRALVLLVIACPCALVISTPVAIVSGLARGARAGVLIKGGAHLENVGHLKALAIDKTGTLTEGRPRGRHVEVVNATTERELLRIAAALESRSEHPLAQAILEHAQTGVYGHFLQKVQ